MTKYKAERNYCFNFQLKKFLCVFVFVVVQYGYFIETRSISSVIREISHESQNIYPKSSSVKRSLVISKSHSSTSQELTNAAAKKLKIIQTAEAVDDEDSCTGKEDKYYPNLSSNCTSYYFCAAGYQTTYICNPGLKFNGDKCTSDYKCLEGGRASGSNPCLNLPNGYYRNEKNPHKYYYCYYKAKVIELSCSSNKVYDGNHKKCVENSNEVDIIEKNWRKGKNGNCEGKSNGFYPNLESGCVKYFYCIKGIKTELECQSGFIFNGDICVQETSGFNCPKILN